MQLGAPKCRQEDNDSLTYDTLHQPCRRPGYALKVPRAASKKRLSAMGAFGHKGARDAQDGMPDVAGKRSRSDELHPVLASREKGVKEHAQWWISC